MQPEKLDIVFYNGLLDMSIGVVQKIEEELIPSYAISEALQYFSSKEEYEKCIKIKKFFDANPDYIANSTKEEWFGLVEEKA